MHIHRKRLNENYFSNKISGVIDCFRCLRYLLESSAIVRVATKKREFISIYIYICPSIKAPVKTQIILRQ